MIGKIIHNFSIPFSSQTALSLELKAMSTFPVVRMRFYYRLEDEDLNSANTCFSDQIVSVHDRNIF
jgi:hypothetical protein